MRGGAGFVQTKGSEKLGIHVTREKYVVLTGRLSYDILMKHYEVK